MSGPFGYFAYGMQISSDFPLPELPARVVSQPDLRIRRCPTSRVVPERPGELRSEFSDDFQAFDWGGVGSFVVRSPDLVDVDPHPDFEPRFLSVILCGAIMAVVLNRRGLLVLHGSAVRLAQGAMIFLGDKGAGKSTTASAFISKGRTLLADDVVAIDLSDPSAPRLIPGFPAMKLSPEAMAAADLRDVKALDETTTPDGKHRLKLGSPLEPDPSPILAAHVLRRGTRVALEPYPVAEALKAVMRFSYLARFGAAAISGAAARRHLGQCAALASAVGVGELETPDDLGRLGEVVQLLDASARGSI